MIKTLTALLGAFCWLSVASAASPIFINKPASDQDRRYDYAKSLLIMALKAEDPEFDESRIQETTLTMSRDREFSELQRGERLHVRAAPPKPGWEEQLIPIRIPIRRGIQGYRIFLILQENQAMLSQIRTAQQLKDVSTGSGDQWSITRALEQAGFNVIRGNNYEGLFDMLAAKRFITFSRGLNEIRPEYEARVGDYPELAIEQDLLLYTPFPIYFFVAPNHPVLAKKIETGLEILIADGRFQAFFEAEFGDIIKQERLAERKMFIIPNPNLSPETPLDNPDYWFFPEQTRDQPTSEKLVETDK